MSRQHDFSYQGTELDLFAHATNWRAYWSDALRPFIGADVLEVGAGLGSTTRALRRQGQRWTALEPDPALANRIEQPDDGLTVRVGTLQDLGSETFDSIIYVDVLEHIADDRGEVDRAWTHLRPGGVLAFLSPAHQWLYTPFDESIGHYRRYSRASLEALRPDGAQKLVARYLDSAGLLASLGNRLLLKAASPGPRQIAVWDRALVPMSRVVDPLLQGKVGKSLLVIWRKPS